MVHEDARIPPDRQPWDPANGLRVGALVGGLLGAGVVWLTGTVWWLVVGAAAGGAIGWWTERSKRLRSPR